MMTASQRSHYDENASEKDDIELEGSPDGKISQEVVVSSPTQGNRHPLDRKKPIVMKPNQTKLAYAKVPYKVNTKDHTDTQNSVKSPGANQGNRN
jgi:hypothetical protein